MLFSHSSRMPRFPLVALWCLATIAPASTGTSTGPGSVSTLMAFNPQSLVLGQAVGRRNHGRGAHLSSCPFGVSATLPLHEHQLPGSKLWFPVLTVWQRSRPEARGRVRLRATGDSEGSHDEDPDESQDDPITARDTADEVGETDDDSASKEDDNNEGSEGDDIEDGVDADLEYVPYSKPWNTLTRAEMLREVQGLYDNEDETMGERTLLTARAEMTKDQLGQQKNQTEYDGYDVSKEVEILLQASKTKQVGKRKEGASNIPGEVAEGPPEPSITAQYERAHGLHVAACAGGLRSPDGLPAGELRDALQVAAKGRTFLSHRVGKELGLPPQTLHVATILDEDALVACQGAAKAAGAAGLLGDAVEAMGDAYTVMLPYMVLRAVQYDVVAGFAVEAPWAVGGGFMAQVDLLGELRITDEGAAALLHGCVDMLQDALGAEGVVLVRGRVKAFLAAVAVERGSAAERAAKDAAEQGLRPAKERSLLALWESTEGLSMNEELDRIRAMELEVNGPPNPSLRHPYMDPREWRDWAEQTAFESYMGKPTSIEQIFSDMFNNLPGEGSKEWLQQAGVVDEEHNLINKVQRTWVPTPDFGPRYKKNPEDGRLEGAEFANTDEFVEDEDEQESSSGSEGYDDEDTEDGDDVTDYASEDIDYLGSEGAGSMSS